MTEKEIDKMFSGIPHDLFRVHKWRNDLNTLGIVPSEFIKEVSEGKVDYTWPAQVNKLLVDGEFDLILINWTSCSSRSSWNGKLQ